MADGIGWDWETKTKDKQEPGVMEFLAPVSSYFINKSEETGNNNWKLPVITGVAPILDVGLGAGISTTVRAAAFLKRGLALKKAETAAKNAWEVPHWAKRGLEQAVDGAIANRATALASGRDLDDVSPWDIPSVVIGPILRKAGTYMKERALEKAAYANKSKEAFQNILNNLKTINEKKGNLDKALEEVGSNLITGGIGRTSAAIPLTVDRFKKEAKNDIQEEFEKDLDIAIQNKRLELGYEFLFDKFDNTEDERNYIIDELKKEHPEGLPKGQVLKEE